VGPRRLVPTVTEFFFESKDQPVDHDTFFLRYIQSDYPPHGQWHLDVPSGLNVAEKQVERSDTEKFDRESCENKATNESKEIDAVCVTSETEIPNPTKSKLKHDKGNYIRGDPFSGERVILVEVKTASDDGISTDQIYKGIGQLKCYSTHFQEYWDSESVDELLVILGDSPGEYFEGVRDELPIRLFDIANAERLL
jgi:hypothetical protein